MSLLYHLCIHSGAASVQFTFAFIFVISISLSLYPVCSNVTSGHLTSGFFQRKFCMNFSLSVFCDEPAFIIAFHFHPKEYSVLFSLLCLSVLSTLFTCSFSNKISMNLFFFCLTLRHIAFILILFKFCFWRSSVLILTVSTNKSVCVLYRCSEANFLS